MPPLPPNVPRPSPETAVLGRRLRLALNTSGVAFAGSLVLVLLDVGGVFRLPSPLRPALPWVLIGATLAGITLLVGALGTPRREQPGERRVD